MRLGIIEKAAFFALASAVTTGCTGGDRHPDTKVTQLETDTTYFRDQHNRYVYINGINTSGTDKLPVTPEPRQDPRKGIPSFVGRPFPAEQADGWFKVIRSLGFNAIRLVFTWESIEHKGFRDYDYDYLDYIGKIVKAAEDNGVYVLMNMHENLFSRFLFVNYNKNPSVGEPGSIENMLAMVFPDAKALERGQIRFDSRTQGDGAPFWAVKACLPEKNFNSPQWGTFKILGNLGGPYMNFIINTITEIINLINGDTGSAVMFDPKGVKADTEQSFEDWIAQMVAMMQNSEYFKPPFVPFDATMTTDVFPFTDWYTNNLLSWDIDRCYGAFYAGDEVMPNYKFQMDGREVSIKEYFQEAYAGSFAKIAEAVKGRKNIIGYDLINEPPGGYLMLAIMAAYFASDFDTGVIQGTLDKFVGPDISKALTRTIFLLNLIPLIPPRDFFEDLYIEQNKADYNNYCSTKGLPPETCKPAYLAEPAIKTGVDKLIADTKKSIRAQYSADDINMMGALNVTLNFTNYLMDLIELITRRIQTVDPDAIIWLEGGSGALDSILGVDVWRPPSIKQMVFSPHWYPDIYPYFGIGSPPRDFDLEEWMLQDFTQSLKDGMASVNYTFGPVPVVYGEFGTYFNYGGIDKERASGYRISSQILNNYYEAFDNLMVGRMVWNFSVNNDYTYGDWWNYEDFSLLGPKNGAYPTDKNVIKGPDGADYPVRGGMAFQRPMPFAWSGKPIGMSFHSDYTYYVPEKGKARPLHEFHMSMASKETSAPTEIYVPDVQYPEGFYVWLTDGWVQYDKKNQMLYYYPTGDLPDWVHEVTIRMPQKGVEMEGWSYYFDRDGRALVGKRQY